MSKKPLPEGRFLASLRSNRKLEAIRPTLIRRTKQQNILTPQEFEARVGISYPHPSMEGDAKSNASKVKIHLKGVTV